ncbi:MAG: IS66 family insertion sequence element accessory protein TnpB [Terriglobia bacterium]
MHDASARERARVSSRRSLRHAQELRRLHALVAQSMEPDAFAGHLVVFPNRRRDRIKIRYCDRDGFAGWAKRYLLKSAEAS